MADILVVFSREMLNVTKVEPTSSFERGLLVTAAKAKYAEVVLVNGVPSASVVPVSENQLLAEVPESVMGDVIRSVSVLSYRPTQAGTSALTVRLLRQAKRAQGISRLVQRYVLMLFTDPGSDLFSPDLGGGLTSLVNKVISGNQGTNLQSSVQQCISKASRDLERIDASNSRLTDDERLDQAVLSSLLFDPNALTIAARIGLTAISGEQAISNLFA